MAASRSSFPKDFFGSSKVSSREAYASLRSPNRGQAHGLRRPALVPPIGEGEENVQVGLVPGALQGMTGAEVRCPDLARAGAKRTAF
jgi:hypothetical protein